MNVLRNPRIQGRGLSTRVHREAAGNCVLCAATIVADEQYYRVPGVLGKVCAECHRP